MPVIARSPEGKVVSLWGTALIRGADGQLRALKVGDLVRKGDQILTTQNGIVQISNGDADTPAAVAKTPADNEVDRAISELNTGDRQAAPAAGLAGGEGGSLESALRVDRISEGLGSFEVPRVSADADLPAQFDATGTAVAEPEPEPATGLPALGAPSSAISAAEEGSTTNLGLAAPTGPAVNGSIRVDQVPAVGEIHKADGTLVTAGTVLTPADLPGLVYLPPADYDGVVPVGNFSYTLTADGQTVSGGTSITLTAVNDPPVATPATLSGNEDGALPVSLGGTDVDGRIVGVTVTSIPAGATLLLADGATPVLAGQTLTPEQAASLLFRPAADFSGNQTILFTVTDNGGAVSTPAAVSMTVVAVNDLPVPNAGSGGSGAEDAPVAVRLGGTDVDGSVTAVTVTTLPANGTLYLAGGATPVVAGTPLTPAQAANLVFVPNPDFNGNVGIGFTVTDNDGATSAPATAVVTVAPANDGPRANADGASFAEDSVATGNVLGNDSDVDGPALSVASFVFGGVSFPAGSTAIVGGVGTLVINADGSWRFTPAPDFNGPVPAIQVTTTDGSLSATSTLSLTVTPVNDAPLAQDDLASTPINTPATIAVLANDSDVEGQALTVTGASLADPSQGSVTVNADGTLGFAPALNFTGTATISYTVRDAAGASSTATVTVNVGNNNAPDGTDVTRSLPEDGSYTLQAGDFGYTDADAGQTLANLRIDSLPAAGALLLDGVPVTAGTVVSLAQLAAGELAFAPAAEGNGAAYASFGFSVQDSSGGFDTTPNTFRFDVTPVNDAPVATVDTAGTNEDTALTLAPATLLVNDGDVDGDTLTITSVQGAVNGTVALVGGNVVFTPAANYNGPASFTYTVVDGNGGSSTATVNLTINAAGDAALMSIGAGSVTEDVGVTGGKLSTGGTLTITDPDAGEASFQAQSVNGAYGSFTLGTDGVWTYVASNANPAIQALGAGDTLSETFTVRSADGTTSSVVVTVNGSNDAAVISAGTGAVTEDVGVVAGNIATGGTLTLADPDAGEATFTAQTTAGAYGSFALAANGVWTYTASNTNPAIQALGTGDTLTETFTVNSTDGTTSSVVVTINGSNDAAVISAGTGSITEDVGVVGGNISTSGTLTISDADNGEATFNAQTTAGAYGSFTLGTNGAWAYSASNTNPAIQALGSGDTLTETFTVTSVDGTTSSVVVTLNGTNDAAVISAGTGSVTEDVGVVGGNIATGGTLTISDADSGEASFAAQTTAGAYGNFTLAANGGWTYTALNTNPAIQALGTGDTLTETFTVTSADGTTSTVVVTLNGTNDAAVISAGTGSITEDVGVVGGSISTGGTLSISDADSGEASFTAQTTAGTYGSFTLAASGAWTYTAANTNPAIQALGVGDTLTETFTVTSTDGTTSSVVVTLNGSNDGPLAQGNALSTDEDTALTMAPATLLANDNDVDGDTLTIASVQDAVNGSVALVGGNVVFTPTANYSGPASFTYTVSDGNGGTSTATVSLTINPVNDAPAANADTASTAINTALPSIAVLANDGDADGDTLTVTSATLANPALGSVSINPDGTLAFTPALNVAGLVTIDYTISDGHGGTSSATLAVNVGANNAPTGADATITIAEDGSRSFTAADFGFADVDLGQSLAAVRVETLPAAGTLMLGGVAVVAGQVIDAADFGQLVFAPAPNASGNAYAGFTFSVQDSAGAFDASPNSITVNVAPAPDTAVISGVADGATVEDTALSTGGQLLVNDPDAGEAAFQPQLNAAGTYGSLSIDAGGAWTYTLNNGNPVVQSLAQGETRTDTFTVRSIDGTPQLITITVTGTNDAAVISAGASSLTEDTNVVAGNLSTGGTLTIADADAGQASFQAQAANGAYGSFTLGTDGAWTYVASNVNPAIQALGTGDTLTETFTVTSTDGTTSSVVVTINGTNDAAVISAGTGSVTEDVGVVGGNIATGGTLSISDADSGEASFAAQTTAGAYGSFTLAANGAWTYTALNTNPAVQALGTGDTLTETFTVTSADGTTSSVVVTINGSNDAAVISAGTGSISEDVGVVGGNIATSGTLTIGDADDGEATFTAQATAGAFGNFTLGTNGAWTYTASNTNPAIQALRTGDTLTETFTVTSADGTPSSVVVTINGTNDAAVISAGTGSITEDVGVVGGNIATGGTLTISDTDSGDGSFAAQTTAGAYGSFTLGSNGAWAYTASNSNPAIQSLGTGDTLTETFTVTSADGTSSSVVVTINGSNDAAVISAGAGSVTEDVGVIAGNISTGGTLAISDTDSGEASFTAQTTAGAYGSFSLGTNGVWAYSASNSNPAIQALGVGDTLTETFTVTSADGTTSSVVVTIHGTNDAAVISAGTGSITEDVGVVGGNIATGGALTISDADGGEASFAAQTTAGAYGSFTLAANGVWTYTASNSNPAIQSLRTGDTLTETFTITSADGTTSSVVVTINGSNDAAVISAGTGSITEDVGVVGGNISTGGALTISDTDSGEASFAAQTTAGSYGSFTLGTDGVWAYTAANSNPAIQALGSGDTLTETFTVTSADGTTSSVVVTINGSNDAAVISAGTGSISEDVGVVGGNIATGGALTISDADGGEASFAAQTTAGTYGSFTLGTNGAWAYTASNSNPAIQALGTGDTLTETFTVTSVDGTTSSVVVTINGSNDAAVISAGTGSVTEDVGVVGGNIATGGTLTISDTDSGEASFAAQATAGTYGSFTLAANGVWTYTASNTNPAIQALGTGDTLTETFTVTSVDGTTSSVVVTLNGTNDAAVISAGTGSVTEDVGVVGGNITTGGTLTISDADSGEASFTAQTTAGTYGSFSLAANGVWTYTASNANPAIQALGTGDTLTETFTVTSADGTTSSVVVTINGTNDAAVISAGTGSITEDVGVVGGNIATGGTLSVSDADSSEATFAAQTTAGTYGNFALAANGVWAYTASNTNPAIQALGTGDTLTETFTVASADGTTSSVVVTINGTNDAAVISAGTGSITEDVGVVGGNIATGGTLTVTDADAGQASFEAQASTAGSYGTFTLAANGAWTYSAANGNPAIQALGVGQTLTETFTVRSTDGTTSSVVVTLNGSNDGPVAQAASFSVAEDAAIVNGAVTATDIDNGGTHTFALDGAAPAGLSFNSNGTYSFNPADAAYQSLAAGQTQLITVPYTVTDDAGATSTADLVITVTGTNDQPTAVGSTVNGVEDGAVVIEWSAFGVSDVDSATLSIQVTSLPTDGTLQYFNGSAWVSASANQTVSRTDIDAGRLRFVPDANESGDGSFAAGGVGNLNQDYARIGFRPYDGSSFGADAWVDVDIQPVADAPTLQINPVPPSLGLTLQFYDNVPTVSPSNAGSTSTVETALQALAPTSTSQTSNLAVASVGVDDAYRATGYIYLQAGNTYSLSGYRDDTLLAKIGGTTVYSLGYNNYGNFSASGFTPTVSGYYSFEVVMYNGDGPGALDINLAVNGGTPVDLSTANFSLYPDAASLTATGTAVGSFVANNDGGYFPQRLSGPEDGYIRLGALGVSQLDTDGSETLAVSVSGLQPGGTLTDGSHSFTATAGNASVALAGWDLANLQYRAPADFNGSTELTISATTSEPNGSSATTTLTLPIDVIPVNDAPVGMPDTATANEGSSGTLASVLVNDTDLESTATGVAQFAASAGGSAVTANGVNTINTALGGTVVMNADGTYRYFAPAVSHGAEPVVDSFAYRPTDGSAIGNWTTVSVTLNDSTPSATSDAGTVAWNSSVSGNLLTNDAAIDAAKSLVSINGVPVSASGTTTLTLANGTLQVAADGAFTYTSTQAASGTAGGSSETAWRGSVDGLWGFTNANWSSGGNLDVTALATQPDLVNYQGGSKPGIEVGNSGIEFGENLIVQLPESSTQATVSLSQLNASQPTATWFAYDGSGNLVGSGTFAAGPSNGSASVQTITTSMPFEYLRFTNTLSGGQGFLVSTVQYNKLASTHVDTVSYTMQDGDGDMSVATLTLTPGTTSSFTTSLPAGTAGDDSMTGTVGADTLSGSDGHDQLRGLGGADTLNGGNGNDLLSGAAGNDTLGGGAGNDILIGGSGNDNLSGGGGADVFQWQLADRGTAGTPAVDTITDFNASAASAGGDVLDLRDLLQGETLSGGVGNLAAYLHFSTSGGTTTIQISSSGAFTGGNYGTATDQTIVLQNVNLFNGGLTTDQQVIQDLLNKSKLVVDIG